MDNRKLFAIVLITFGKRKLALILLATLLFLKITKPKPNCKKEIITVRV